MTESPPCQLKKLCSIRNGITSWNPCMRAGVRVNGRNYLEWLQELEIFLPAGKDLSSQQINVSEWGFTKFLHFLHSIVF